MALGFTVRNPSVVWLSLRDLSSVQGTAQDNVLSAVELSNVSTAGLDRDGVLRFFDNTWVANKKKHNASKVADAKRLSLSARRSFADDIGEHAKRSNFPCLSALKLRVTHV